MKIEGTFIILPDPDTVNCYGINKIFSDKFGNFFMGNTISKESVIELQCSRQHLYFLSKEEIKANDWCLCNDKLFRDDPDEFFINQCRSIENDWIMIESGSGENSDYTYKIVATTDLTLNIPLLPFALTKRIIKECNQKGYLVGQIFNFIINFDDVEFYKVLFRLENE